MNPPPPGRRVAVIGGGITGLTAAWHLHRAGLTPVVFEKAAHPGGVIRAVQSNGWLHELGPNSLLEGSPEVARLVDDIGLGPRRLYAGPAARNRFIVRDGRLVAMPTSPVAFVTTPLFSWRGKLRLLGEPWRAPGAAGSSTETVADFVVRRLGREILDYAINPFVGGVYAGDPARLAVRHAFPKLHALEQEHGSLIRGAIKRRDASDRPKGRIFSFPRGLPELPEALAGSVGSAVRLGAEVKCIRRIGRAWQLDGATGLVPWSEAFPAVVCALPADALASIVIEGIEEPRRLSVLREIEHPPVASVLTGFRRADVSHPLDGFGMLVPEVEGGRILGTLFSSTLFPGRAPEGHVALTTFIGGMRDPAIGKLDDEEVFRTVQDELSRLLGVSGPPVFLHIQRWPRAIPQYGVGYERYKDTIAAVEKAAPRLFIGGNCRDGISLANCIESGRRLAERAGTALGS